MNEPQHNMKPKPMVLACPDCGQLHVDGEVSRRIPHERHLCLYCGCEWKPYDFPTVGVPPKLGLPTSCRADEVPPGGLFRKPKGELYYLRIGEFGLLHNFGPKGGFANPGLGMRLGKLIFGVSYNGNMTAIERNKPVVRGTLADMMRNVKEYRNHEHDVGVHGEVEDEDEDPQLHFSSEFRQD